MQFIETRDQQKLYYKDWGHGRPIVLIHGWPLSADTWDEVAVALVKNGYRAVFYDRRGFGRSSQPYTSFDYDTLADDLNAVMTTLKLEDASVFGFSMGGGEVARYMSRHSGRNIRSVGLIASVVPFLLKTPDNPQGADASLFEGMVKNLSQDRAGFFGEFFKNFYGVGMLKSPVSEEVLDWSRTLAMQASYKATIDCVESFGYTDFRGDLPHFRVPTLIIHGTGDAIVPIDVSARQAAAGIAGSKLVEYEGGPHGLFASHRQRLIGDMLEFLKGTPS